MLRKLHESKNEEGFTLIELLVVVIIIGILAAIAIPAFLNQRENAYRSAVQSDLRNAAIEMETAFTQGQEYPDTLPASVQESTGVTLTLVEPATGTTGAQAFCITGAHDSLDSGTVTYVYDSDAGGVREDSDCTPPA